MTRPACSDLEPHVIASLKRLLGGHRRLMVAVSGGSDSMGLLQLAARARAALDLEVTVGFVNHGLRAEAVDERVLVEQAAGALEIPVRVKAVPPAEAEAARCRGSLQSWARERRYQLLLAMAESQGITHIATAHTSDDQAETLLIRMLRGCGLDGLVGIRPFREAAEGITLIRPLLGVTREAIRAYLTRLEVAWAEDPSNRNPRFLRTRVREELLPLMNGLQPETSRRLSALARDITAVVDLLDSERFISELSLDSLRLNDGMKIDHAVFAGLPRGLWGRVVRHALRRVRGDLRRLDRRHIEAVERHLSERGTTGALPLPGDAVAYVERGSLLLFPRPLPPVTAEVPLERVDRDRWRAALPALDAAVEVRSEDGRDISKWVLRTRRPGDRLYRSSRKIKTALAKAGLPRIYRDYMPLLVDEDSRVVAYPGGGSCRHTGVTVSWSMGDSAPLLDFFSAPRN